MAINKLIDNLVTSLQEIKDLDLSGLKDSDLDTIKSYHEKIKLTQKLTSEFQKEVSPIQKKVNRKRIDLLKKKGRDPKNLTKAELIERLALLEAKLGPSPKE